MNRLFLSLISLAACMTSCTSPEPLTDYVDPRIGTAHSRWFFFCLLYTSDAADD